MPVREFYDQALLDRFRPRLRYDRQYDYLTTAAETMVENPGNLLRRRDGDVVARVGGEPALSLDLLHAGYPSALTPDATDCLCQGPDRPGDWRRMEGDQRFAERVYGRCVEDGGMVWLQYWLWLYYNPKNLFGFGKHEGDWEMVQVGLRDGEPEVATYAQHDAGEARRFADGRIEVERAGGDGVHPVVYVAPLSHASYFEAGTHAYLPGIDHPYGDGPRRMPPVVPLGPWAHWPGRWGNSDNVLLGKVGDGPPGPAGQGLKWTSPAAWHEKMAKRRPRVWLGRLVHLIGAATFPPTPEVAATRQDDCVHVDYRLPGTRAKRGRHLYLSVHDGERVLESRAVRNPGPEGRESLLVPGAPAVVTLMASAFNAVRQRSDVVVARVPAQGGAPADAAGAAAAAG
jgi:hypothetical protein